MEVGEVTESAKAVQEIAKTTGKGLDLTEKLGLFLSRILARPIDESVGMLTDHLKFKRWERRQRLIERSEEMIESKRIIGELRPLPPKIAIPAIENGSLEEDNELQDMWARLIASGVDPNHAPGIRSAYIGMLKELEVTDAHILQRLNAHYQDHGHRSFPESDLRVEVEPHYVPLDIREICDTLNLTPTQYMESVDNLFRLRCAAPFIGEKSVLVPQPKQRLTDSSIKGSPEYRRITAAFKSERVKFNVNYVYDRICITRLGLSFARACMV